MTNPFKKFRIESLFFRSFAVLIIVLLVIIAWTSYSISSKALVRTTSHYQQKLLDELNNEISTRLDMIEQISLSTSRDNELITFLTGQKDEFDRYRGQLSVERALANLTYSIPLIQGIDLYMNQPLQGDPKSYIQFRALADLKLQVWAQYLEKNDFAWSSEHEVPSFQGDTPVLSFARKIIYNDASLGVVVIHVKAKEIRALLTGNSSESNRMMTNAEGQQFMKIGHALDQDKALEWMDLGSRKSGYAHIRDSGEGDSLLVYSRLENSNWTLVEITSWNQITASSFRLAEVILLIGLGAVLLVLLITHRLSREFTKPIKKLVTAMRMYSVGGNNMEMPTDYENEFGYVFAGYRKQNERIEELYDSLQRRYEQQRKAEIEALQANINPHFLYNMLDQLNWMAIEAGQDELSQILELMGRMFRLGLSGGSSFITVEEELEHVGCYLQIQQLRWGEGLDYSIAVPADIRQLFIPKLTLQPFVENSMVHGFNKRTQGHVHIGMDSRDNALYIIIEDDGSGLKQAGDPPTSSRKTGGYGIRNVRERINGYFGEEYGITLRDREEGGTRVEIVIPLLAELPVKPALEQGIS